MIEARIGARRHEPEGLVIDDVDDPDRIHRVRVYGGVDRSAAGLRYTGGPRSGGTRLHDPALGDAYAILGVAPGSDDETIAAAYRNLARVHHPDIAGDAGTSRMIRVNAAFDRIRTAERRAAYDREHGGRGGRRPAWAPEYDGTGGAGPPPGRPSGSVLGFGRHLGWSIGEIARVDPGYLLWLEDRVEGQPFLDEIDRVLQAVGIRRAGDAKPERGGRSRRR